MAESAARVRLVAVRYAARHALPALPADPDNCPDVAILDAVLGRAGPAGSRVVGAVGIRQGIAAALDGLDCGEAEAGPGGPRRAQVIETEDRRGRAGPGPAKPRPDSA